MGRALLSSSTAKKNMDALANTTWLYQGTCFPLWVKGAMSTSARNIFGISTKRWLINWLLSKREERLQIKKRLRPALSSTCTTSKAFLWKASTNFYSTYFSSENTNILLPNPSPATFLSMLSYKTSAHLSTSNSKIKICLFRSTYFPSWENCGWIVERGWFKKYKDCLFRQWKLKIRTMNYNSYSISSWPLTTKQSTRISSQILNNLKKIPNQSLKIKGKN